MKQCPSCKRELKEHLLFCPFDGQPLLTKSDQDKFIGTVIDDKYRLEEKIGEGGMGKVYKATHIHMDHLVAVKILHPHLASDQTALERFRREARAAAYIRHPNAVAVTDFGVTKDTGIAYLVMEFLEGIELREKIKNLKQLDIEETFLIVQQTCSALHAAHSKGIIHRDLKPDNIWLLKSEDGMDRVKVLDFGIAKLKTTTETSKLTQQGMIVGTPYYMSPEQCRGEELDARSDIYSLGIILYEMLTGQVPFQASTPVGVVLKHANEPPQPPHELRTDLPEPIEGVVLRALKKKREDRQDSAVQLAQELEGSLYAAGIELKLLGTNTPQSPYSVTHSSSPPRTNPPFSATGDTKSAAAELTDASMPSRDQTGRIRSTASVSPGQSTLSIFDESPSTTGAAGQRKMLLIIGAAIAALAVVAAIIFMTRGGDERTRPVNANVSTDPGQAKPLTPPDGMALIPAGKFIMGTEGPDADPSEKPEHEVVVNAFFMDKYEVTVEDYYKFVKAENRRPPGSWSDNWKRGVFADEEKKLPVTNVSWFDANEYSIWAGKRLPTEIEWEYAARSSDKRLYPWGNDFNPSKANVKDSGRGKLMPVGSFPTGQSQFGLFDMAGNVAEWTSSDSRRYPGGQFDPSPGKIVRGGSFTASRVFAMVTTRAVNPPNRPQPELGFRCAKDAK